MNESDLVLSDVHINSVGKADELQLTRFKFRVFDSKRDTAPTAVKITPLEYDEDGDLIVTKAEAGDCDYDVISIQHRMSTRLEEVGLQVWRGALLMCDFVSHNPGLFRGTRVLELGAGAGLTGLVAGQHADAVTCTDTGPEVVALCRNNIRRNSRLLREGTSVSVRSLNWFNDVTIEAHDVIIACDCVYDNDLTDALFRTIYRLMTSPRNDVTRKPTTYLSLEKRLNFTLDDLEVTCHEYTHFRECLEDIESLLHVQVSKLDTELLLQYFEYERVKELEIWEIRFK